MNETLYDIWQRDHGGDFSAGVRLLMQAAPTAVSPNIARRLLEFSRGNWAPDYLAGKLDTALRATPASGIQEAPVAPKAAQEKTEEYPGATPALRAKAKALHKEHAHYHALMIQATTDAERADLARKIMLEILPALDKLYDAMRKPTQEAPAETQDRSSGALLDNVRRLNTLRTRISRLRNKYIPNAATMARRQELEKELETCINERNALEQALASV